MPYCDVDNDLWGMSHFNFEVEEGINYHVLRTGAFPFIKFHCSKRQWENLKFEDYFYRALKILNLGTKPVLVRYIYFIGGGGIILLSPNGTEVIELNVQL